MSDSEISLDIEEKIKQNFQNGSINLPLKTTQKSFLGFLQEYEEIIENFPKSVLEVSDEDEDEEDTDKGKTIPVLMEKTERVKKIEQLQEKLQALRGKSLSKVGVLERKGLKNRLKKKIKKEERMKIKKQGSYEKKLQNAKLEINCKEEKKKDKMNTEENGEVIFSKFDFADDAEKKKKGPRDPFRILQKVEKSNKKLREMEARGRTEKVKEIKGKIAWDVAIKKAEGEKVKDDVELLKKSIRKIKNAKNRSKKKWEQRENTKIQKMEEAQKKRKTNLLNKKKEKKKKKVKKLIKKGRIVQ